MRGWAVALVAFAVACSSFGTEDGSSSSDGGTTPGTEGGAPGTSYCSKLTNPAAFCDDFDDSTTLTSTWSLVKPTQGFAEIANGGSSAPHYAKLAPTPGTGGVDCNGGQLEVSRALPTITAPTVRVHFSLSADTGTNGAYAGNGNVGPEIVLSDAAGRCTLFVAWQSGAPHLYADVLPTGASPQQSIDVVPLGPALSVGEWRAIDIDVVATKTGLVVRTDGHQNSLPACTSTTYLSVGLNGNCANGPVAVGVDDFAVLSVR